MKIGIPDSLIRALENPHMEVFSITLAYKPGQWEAQLTHTYGVYHSGHQANSAQEALLNLEKEIFPGSDTPCGGKPKNPVDLSWNLDGDSAPPEGSLWDVIFRQIAWAMEKSGKQNYLQMTLNPRSKKAKCQWMPEEPESYEMWEPLLHTLAYSMGCYERFYLEVAIDDKQKIGWSWTETLPEEGKN